MVTRMFVALITCCVATAGAQTSQNTFTSRDGAFRLRYASMLLDCMSKDTAASDSCMRQGGLCSGPGSDATTKVCFRFSEEKSEDKPMFVAATFFVSEIESPKTEKVCTQPYPNWLVLRSKGVTVINRVSFSACEIGDNWLLGGTNPDRCSLHNHKCYEWGIQTVRSRAAYHPESHNNLTDQDLAEVDDRLKETLRSFVFLK